MNDDKARRAIVTGGGTGLGQAAVKQLLSDGFEVWSLGMDVEDVIDHERHQHIEFDVTDIDAIAELSERFDGLDALVNAAGIILHEGREWTNDGFERLLDVNLLGTQKMCFGFEEQLKRSKGAIVNFASMWSMFGSGRNPGYSASKGAVESLTRALAVGWGGDGVRANAVAPGWVKTRMSVNAMSTPERAEPIMKRIPSARWGESSEVGSVIGFLVSPAASYVNGVVLPIDGGYSIA